MPEELLARLQNLENSYYGDKQIARQNDFMSRYGSRFSNNKGLGIAILNELDARGIDTSAADEAVQSILDQLRMECQEILDSLTMVQDQAVENQKKLDTIADVIDQQLAANSEKTEGGPEEAQPEMPPAPAETPMIDNSAELGDQEFVPEEPAPEEPAPEEPAPEEPAPEEPAPELPPNQVTSDIRMKRIQHMKSHWGATRAQKKAEKEKNSSNNTWKPSSGMLDACGGN
jgi:hypothetical protein